MICQNVQYYLETFENDYKVLFQPSFVVLPQQTYEDQRGKEKKRRK